MGAWGRNVFQNDTALDIVDEVLDGTFDLDEFRRNFRRDEDEGHLTASQGAALLTLGALVRIARNEDHADLEALLEHAETDEVDLTAFIDQFSDEDVETLRELIGGIRDGVSQISAAAEQDIAALDLDNVLARRRAS